MDNDVKMGLIMSRFWLRPQRQRGINEHLELRKLPSKVGARYFTGHCEDLSTSCHLPGRFKRAEVKEVARLSLERGESVL